MSDQETIQTLRDNKREMFDSMRAYHESEISHATNAVTMMLGIVAAVGAGGLAILFPQSPPRHIQAIAWGLLGAEALLTLTIALTAHRKINRDHTRYADSGKEYVTTCRLLGLYSAITVGGKTETIKEDQTIGQGKGYRRTQQTIWTFAVAITLVTIALTVFVARTSHPPPAASQNQSHVGRG
jgi:hypothetical protein